MPNKLIVEQNQLVHTGVFSRPLLELWGAGGVIFTNLYNVLSPFGVKLSDIRSESLSQNPADQAVAVSIGLSGVHRFRFDRIELTFFNFTDELLLQFPQILEATSRWLREAVSSFQFASHQFVYSSHSRLDGTAVADVLKFMPSAAKSGGVDRGTGAIFHWEVPDRNWATQLLVDRSLLVPEGVFLMFTLEVKGDSIDYVRIATEGRSYLEAVLAELGLAFEIESN